MKTARAAAAVAIPFVVFLVALAPRLSSPSPFITWDEPTWTYRSLKFTRALETGDFAAAWQSPHPGVVTLWAGSAGIVARRLGIANGGGVESGSAPASESVSELGVASGSESETNSEPGSDSPDPDDLAWVDELPPFDEDDVDLLRRILPWHPAARAAIGWLTAALIGLATWILLPLVGARTAAIAGLLIALDPYLLAHSRVLHLDAVLALLITCSALAILRAYHASAGHRSGLGTSAGVRAAAPVVAGPDPATATRGPRLEFVPNTRWIAASAALGALAALEKSPGAFAAGFAVLVIVVGAFGSLEGMRSTFGVGAIARTAHPEGDNRPTIALRILRPLAIWGAVAGVTYFAAWPSLWAEPIGTFQRMAAYAAEAAGESREAVYFLGAVRPDPGAHFYAVAIPHRLTPLALFGFIAGIVVIATAAAPRSRSSAAWMLVLIVLFTILMGRSAKKFERYDLPVFPAIQIVVAVGLVGAAGRVERSLRPRSEARRIAGASQIATPDRATLATLSVLAALVLAQAAFTLRHRPYDLSYYNPLLGGGPAAAQRLPVGWGEGSDLVVEWLNAQAGAAESSVATPSMTLIGPGFVGRTLKARDWAEADFVVLYIDDVQIREPREIVEEFHGPRTPRHVVQLNGIDYAWIYAALDAE